MICLVINLKVLLGLNGNTLTDGYRMYTLAKFNNSMWPVSEKVGFAE